MTALRRIAGLAASVVVLTVPLAAAADTSTLSVSMSVPSDCTVTTAGPVTLAFGAIDLIRGAHAAAPTALVGIACNNGTIWHLAADKTGTAPADLSASGYTHGFAQNAAVTYTVKASVLGGTSTTSAAPANVTLSGTFNTLDPPVGTYSDSFVLSVMI